jgi:hypothetical protein
MSEQDRSITRRNALRTGGLAAVVACLLGSTTPAATASLSPADELVSVLRRAESLVLNELRGDDEARSAGYGLALRVAELITYVDPQTPPVLPGWPAAA